MILTPEQWKDALLLLELAGYGPMVETAIAYAEIVERVAETNPTDQENLCPYCNHYIDQVPHTPDCPYLAARKLRGKE